MHEVGLSVDLNFFNQLILTLLFLSIGLLYFVKRTAAKYFEVGASGGFDRDYRQDFMVPDTAECAVCGKVTSKKCSRCKSVRYCSPNCQKSDWNSGHKLKCKVFRVTDSSPLGRDGLDFKASVFGNRSASKIALVPQLSQNKANLKPTDVLFPYESFVRYFNWENPNLATCGLINCGNSCFANVVLQCLSWAILKVEESPKAMELERAWFKKKDQSCPDPDTNPDPNPSSTSKQLGVDSFWLLFLIVFIICVITLGKFTFCFLWDINMNELWTQFHEPDANSYINEVEKCPCQTAEMINQEINL